MGALASPMSYTPKLITELRFYSKEKALADLLAGITVGVVALPLAMAFAIASGLSPERGLFTAIVAGFLISALGGSKVQIGGPTGAFVILVSSITERFGYSGLATATFMAGILLMLFGAFKFGGLIKFIPFPVTTGFTSGIAVVILSTQVCDFLGLKVSSVPSEFIEKWNTYLQNITSFNGQATSVGCATILLIIILRSKWPKLPAMLIAMLSMTLACSLLHLNIETIGTRFGDLPRVLPSPTLPELSLDQVKELFKPALTIALLAAIESLLSATVADGMTGGRHRPNVELIAQGAANIASVIFGGIPATGAIARTATNVKSGARTPVAGMIHAVVLSLLLLLFASYAKLIPLATLAGILIVISYNMSEPHHFYSILKGPKSDSFVLILTFLLTILVDLTLAVECGVVVASLLFIKRMSEITNIGIITKELRGDEDIQESKHSISLRQVPDGVEVFEVNGPFFFGVIDTFRNSMRLIEKRPRVLIIRTRNVTAVDATAIHVLRELHRQCKRENTLLLFSGVQPQPRLVFEKSGFLEEVGRENFLANIDESLNRAKTFMELPG